MTEIACLENYSMKAKEQLLKALDYGSDGEFVLDANGERIVDPYTNEQIRTENMLILPGSTIILDNNPLSIVSYLEDHPNVSLF